MSTVTDVDRVCSEIDVAQRADPFGTYIELYALLGDAYADAEDPEMERVCRWLVGGLRRPFFQSHAHHAVWSWCVDQPVRGSPLPSEIPVEITRRFPASSRDTHIMTMYRFRTVREAVEALRGLVW